MNEVIKDLVEYCGSTEAVYLAIGFGVGIGAAAAISEAGNSKKESDKACDKKACEDDEIEQLFNSMFGKYFKD